MIRTYEAYLNHPAGNTLTIEDAMKIYQEMAESIMKCTLEDKMDFWDDCLRKASEYAYARNMWEHMDREEKMEKDPGRSLKHDAFITSINILARIAEKEGIENSWRQELGNERMRIGDFACFVAYIVGTSNR